MKLCVDPNGRIKLRVKQKYEILSAKILFNINHLFADSEEFTSIVVVVGNLPMTRMMDQPKGYINQELSWSGEQ